LILGIYSYILYAVLNFGEIVLMNLRKGFSGKNALPAIAICVLCTACDATQQTLLPDDGEVRQQNGQDGQDGQDGQVIVVTQTADNGSSNTPLSIGSPDNDYFLTQIEGNNCLAVGEDASFLLTGTYFDEGFNVVKENLSGLATVTRSNGAPVEILSVGDSGIALRMNQTGIAELSYSTSNISLSQIIGAIDSSISRPVILERQLENRCTFMLFGQNNSCATVSGGRSDGSGSSFVSLGNSEGIASDETLSIDNCVLQNPNNIPVIPVN